MDNAKSFERLSTIGVLIGYGTSDSLTVAPETVKEIPAITSVPDLAVDPENIDVTTLSDVVNKKYVQGLSDYGGALAFEALYSDDIVAEYDEILKAYEKAKTEKKEFWVVIVIPTMKYSTGFPCEPLDKVLPAAIAINESLKTSLRFNLTGDVNSKIDKPTVVRYGDETVPTP